MKTSRLGKPSCLPRQVQQIIRRGQFTRPLRPDSKALESWTSARRPNQPSHCGHCDTRGSAVQRRRAQHVRGARLQSSSSLPPPVSVLAVLAPAPAARPRATRSAPPNRARESASRRHCTAIGEGRSAILPYPIGVLRTPTQARPTHGRRPHG
jgi:hypothetical protein